MKAACPCCGTAQPAQDLALPGWPSVLHEAWAAAYLSLSTFRTQVVPDVPAVQLASRRVGWLRSDLDKWLALRCGDPAASPSHNPWDDP